MAKVFFDFGATTNGVGTPSNPRNTLTGYTFVAGDEHFFKRGTTWTGSFSLTAGLPNKRTKYNAWFYADGSDELSQPRPIFNLTAGVSTFASTNKDNVDLSSLELRATITAASDTAVVFAGHNFSITNCVIDTNVGCVYSAGKNNVGIYYSTLKGVTHAAAGGNNNVITVSDTRTMDNISVVGNRIVFGNGGNTQSHGLRAECSSTSNNLRNLVIESNIISPPDGVDYTTNLTAIGMRLQRCPDAKVRFNEVRGMLSALFLVGGGPALSIYAGYNTFKTNLNFGIHLTSDTQGCILEYNDCSYNGTSNTAASAYGRGIELSSSSGQGKCSGHIVRFNVCNYNKNYGGPADNGSEGVGIGLDDGTMGCWVYGNTCIGNEGNGVQYYGGNSSATWTDTGANHVVANYLENNCTASLINRRTGGTAESAFIAHIALTSTYGSATYVANNVMVGGKLGISVTNNCQNFTICNNIFSGIPNGVQFGGSPIGCFNNVFWKKTLQSMNKYCTMTTGSGAVTFTPLNYTGTSDFTFDPMLDAQNRPMVGSPCIGAGRAIPQFKDFKGRKFKDSSSIGMHEVYSSAPALHI